MVTTAGDCFLDRTLGEFLADYSNSQIKLSGKTQTEHIETVLNFYKHGSLLIIQ